MGFVWWLIGLLVGAGLALGQEDETPATRPSTYVRVSVEAGESLRRMATLEADGQWGQAAEGYDRLMAEAGEELVRVDATHYRNVRERVWELLRAWPVAARKQYAEQLGGRAAVEVGKLSDPAPAELWMGLAERYWLTPAGQAAARKAVERLKAEGRHAAAAKWAAWVLLNASGLEIPDLGAAESGAGEQGGTGERVVEPVGDAWEVIWEQSLAIRKAGETPAPPEAGATGSGLVVVGERVCVQAAGRVWGLGLYSGRVEWIFWPGDGDEEEGEDAVASGERGGMGMSPAGDLVFANVTPYEGAIIGRSVLACIETASGRVVWQVEAAPRDMSEKFRPVEFFDGRPVVYDGRVYAVMRRRRELGYEDCRLVCFEPGTGERLWDAWVASGPAPGEWQGFAGGGLVGRRGDVLVRTHVGVMACIDGVNGRVRWVTENTPAAGTGKEQPVATAKVDGLAVVVEKGKVRCLAPTGQGVRQLTERAEARVDDAEAWLDVSRLALGRVGECERGMEALDRAVGIVAGMPVVSRVDAEREAARVRAQAFEVIVQAAMTPVGEDAGEDERRVTALLARAAELAGSEEEQVGYRLALARRLEEMGRVGEAVQLGQEVLDRLGLRGVAIASLSLKGWGTHLSTPRFTLGARSDGERPRPAGRIAERLIDEWIRRHGRGVYGKFERQAREMAEEGKRKGDAAVWKEAMERYPNAEGLGQMLDTWMTLERKAGRPMSAARFAEDVLRRRTEMDAGVKAAIAAQIAAARAEGHVAWPRVAPPLRKVWEMERADAALLAPQERAAYEEDRAGAEMVLLFEQGRMEALDAATGHRLWEAPVVAVGTPMWLGTRGDLLILATPFQILAVDRRNGAVRWMVGDVPAKAASPAVDPEIFTRIASLTLGQTLAVAIMSDGHGMGVEISSGEVLWERDLPHAAGEAVVVDGAFTAYLAPGEPATLRVLASGSGEEVATFPMDEPPQAYVCAPAGGGRVLVASSNAIACFDPAAKVRQWRIDEPRRIRAGSLTVAGERVYLAGERWVAARSCADGAAVWARDLQATVMGRVLEAWVDGGRVYVLGEGGVAVLEASTGAVRGTTAWGDNAVMGSAWLAGGHLLATMVKPVDVAEGGRKWELAAYWARREMGKNEPAMIDRLGQFAAAPDVAVCGQNVLVRAGTAIIAWGRIDSQTPDR